MTHLFANPNQPIATRRTAWWTWQAKVADGLGPQFGLRHPRRALTPGRARAKLQADLRHWMRTGRPSPWQARQARQAERSGL